MGTFDPSEGREKKGEEVVVGVAVFEAAGVGWGVVYGGGE